MPLPVEVSRGLIERYIRRGQQGIWVGTLGHLNQLGDERTKRYQRKTEPDEQCIQGGGNSGGGGICVFLRLPSHLLQSIQRSQVDTPEIGLGEKALSPIDGDLIGAQRRKGK